MTPSVPARRLPPPELPGHTWLRSLGSGGFADVHLYRQEQPAREVAVKVARSVGDQVEYAQIRHEADVMTSIAGHPAVVELYSIGTSPDGRPYLEMEFCPVANVAEQVRRMPLAVDRALDVVIRLCGGVEMLHRNGYVHRDIKPANVMFDSYSYPVLGDFGVAARIGALEKGSLDGFSVLWAPPEQHNRSTHAHPTQDVWALATTLWTFLSGRSPFEDPVGDNSAASVAARVYEGRIRGLSRPDAPKELERVLRHAMQLDPRKRTSSAAELGRQLQEIQTLMGRPVTKMELRDGNALSSFGGQSASGSSADSSASWNADQSDQFSGGAAQDEATRLRAMPSIDAERTRLRPSSVDLRPSSAPPHLPGAGLAAMFLPARPRPRGSMQLRRVLQVRPQYKLAPANLGILPQLIRRWVRCLHLREGRARRLGRAMRLRRTRGELQGIRPRTLSIPRTPWDICQMVDLRARRESSRSLRLSSWEWLF